MDSIPSPLPLELSTKQKKLIEELNLCVLKEGINLEINPTKYHLQSPISVDVEHDEQGNLVGIGAYDGRAGLLLDQYACRWVDYQFRTNNAQRCVRLGMS